MIHGSWKGSYREEVQPRPALMGRRHTGAAQHETTACIQEMFSSLLAVHRAPVSVLRGQCRDNRIAGRYKSG